MVDFSDFEYGSVDLEEMAAEKAALEEESQRSGFNYMSLEVGRNMIRILPPWEKGRKSPFYKAWVHYVKNPAKPQENGRPFLCPSKMEGKRCIVCEKVSALRRSGNEIDKEIASDLSASRQIYANVVNLDDVERGVQVMKFGKTIYQELLAYMDPADPENVGDLTHPKTGYNVVIDRKGKGKNDTKYSVRIARKSSVIASPEWLGKLNNLIEVVDEMNDEKVRAIMSGETEDYDAKALEAGSDDDDDDVTDADFR
jgi:hypothetical protein